MFPLRVGGNILIMLTGDGALMACPGVHSVMTRAGHHPMIETSGADHGSGPSSVSGYLLSR